MIVVDNNVLVPLLLEGPRTAEARDVRRKDGDWRVPSLWKHEFLNVLVTGGRKGKTPYPILHRVWKDATALFSDGEIDADMGSVLLLAVDHGLTAYDAQYAALAQSLGVPLVTEDKQLIKTFPSFAINMEQFLLEK